MNHLVIGLGEVGSAIREIFHADGHDPNKDIVAIGITKCDVMHICFPYFEGFADMVKNYQEIFNPNYTVVHSTVPIGTCEKLKVAHSPVRGKHPNLVESIKTFVKFVGGQNSDVLVDEFKKHGIPSRGFVFARGTEAMKLWDTTQYGAMIMLEKEIHEFCKNHNLDFNIVYTQANETYNEGYKALGLSHFIRPVLEHQEGKIGGHCVLPNCHLLDSPTPKRILSDN